MTGHLIATAPAPRIPAGGWLRLSAALTEQIETLTGRDDLTVTCAPGAGQGSPGCFIPALATIELDGTHLGHAPSTCDPRRPSDRERYPALWGVFLHESAHVRHSHWHARTAAINASTTTASASTGGGGDEGATSAHLEAATMLEESRIEAAHLRGRPADRRWLRASARQLVLADFTTPAMATTAPATGTGPEPGTPAEVRQVAMTPWEAARAAALVLARVDAGVLEAEETESLAAVITGVLGASRLSALSALWHLAHTTADDDDEAMLELGRRWCTILDARPEEPPPTSEDEEEEEGKAGESSAPSPLTEAIAAVLIAVAEADAPPAPPAGPSRVAKRAAERDAHRRATRAAGRVFTSGGSGSGADRITGTRPPTPAEQAAARKLARHLKAAAHRERTTTTTTSATPPGRLRMRGALAADAQRAAGATPTAEPFTQTTRRHTPTPPLRLGIACDVSGSMSELAAPIASTAWILAKAAASVPDARSATVIFGKRVQPITYPGKTPTRVREFRAIGPDERFCEAVDALDAAVELTRPEAARLLVVVSDGIFFEEERTGGQQRITRLTRHGCAVLWLALDTAVPMDGAHLITLTNPAETADIIGRAATRALRTT
ncbi:VWA domain-containing protein [Actinoallomurus iriomotensis]|uniref:VWA domain containing CoxE-like protein n=1 Tax=Actinoallomurus iriomotensis TaxID=478107 RepID=A0A9W6S063_9ACTN|nr:VWA domain-containing protein [Actinoallomurus iriomotensis]GLY86051.1 hypothetical protein Airi02_039800 [Actinoallomurus iriomotensis]